MLDEILKVKNSHFFDFREHACSHDDLAYLFDDWIDYYNTKHAICKAIQPTSILEIGVRFGYSAISFLTAASKASYLGIDSDSCSFGGSKGAIQWARKITERYNAEFIIADTQSMESLPGKQYDLIHIDGQQDGDGTFHDLEMALQKGRWILVDGFFWSRENMLSTTFFLEKYRRHIEFALIIPGYGGELLIKKKAVIASSKGGEKSGSDLKDSYDRTYYLGDCGGWDSFKRTGGKWLEDSRFLSMFYLTDPRPGEEILDIGCGRGELSYALAKYGKAKVTGIDYSESAIEIAKNTYGDVGDELSIEFLRGDLFDSRFSRKFDRIVAADFVEHVEQNAFAELCRYVRSLLARDGVFIIHTSPNKLNYMYEYKAQRRRAQENGLYLPSNPRTVYEDLMHINEQTPAGLNRTLRKHFKHSITWVATLPDASGCLRPKFSRHELMKATSIFAIASEVQINKDNILLNLFQDKIDRRELLIHISCHTSDMSFHPASTVTLPITIHNNSTSKLISMPPYPIHISYHWLDAHGKTIVFDGLRTKLLPPLMPSTSGDYEMRVMTPRDSGDYMLQISLVQEGNFWFDDAVSNMPLNIRVKVSE